MHAGKNKRKRTINTDKKITIFGFTSFTRLQAEMLIYYLC